MKGNLILSKRLALATAAIFAIAGGVAYAAIPDAGTGLFHACMLKNVGTIRIIDPTKQQCSATLETAIAFGAKGDPGLPGTPGAPGTPGTPGTNGAKGDPGQSPVVQQLASGDAHCQAGGASITDANGVVAYVCSAALTSPNGNYSISVTDNGVSIGAANGTTIDLTSADITLLSHGTMLLQSDSTLTGHAGTDLNLRADNNADIRALAQALLQATGTLSLKGAIVNIN